MVELGIYSVRKGSPITEAKITYIHTTSLTAADEASGKHVIWGGYYYDGPGITAKTPWPVTNLAWVKSRFDLYAQNNDRKWEYGVYLGAEELFHPAIMAEWFKNPNAARYDALATWTIDGELTLYGITVKALKPWYIQKYGSWNQAWWDSAKANNKYTDSIIKEWSLYYARRLYEMWHLHMQALGKKSAIVGYIGIPGIKGATASEINRMWGADLHNYIMNNYDYISAYQYPECISGCQAGVANPVPENPAHVFHSNRDVSWSVEAASILRGQFKGKLDWILTAHWGDSVGTSDKAVELAEYQAVLPYADIISLPEFTNMYRVTWPGIDPGAPKLVEFCQATGSCPGSGNDQPPQPQPQSNPVKKMFLVVGGTLILKEIVKDITS